MNQNNFLVGGILGGIGLLTANFGMYTSSHTLMFIGLFVSGISGFLIMKETYYGNRRVRNILSSLENNTTSNNVENNPAFRFHSDLQQANNYEGKLQSDQKTIVNADGNELSYRGSQKD